LGIYFLNRQQRNWDLEVIQRQMNVVRDLGMGGQAFFRSEFLLNNEKGLYDWLQRDFYATPALTPAMTWADSTPPAAPQAHLTRTGNTIHLEWAAVEEESPIYYNVYRIDKADDTPKLLGHRLQTTSCRYTPSLPLFLYSQYAVTSIDAYGNESPICPLGDNFYTEEKRRATEEKVKKAQEHLRGKK
jgi:fibronectin type 3 domain-containing protein